MKIREMTELDLEQVVSLCCEFGFPVKLGELLQRFRRLRQLSSQEVFVAETKRDNIIGWVHIYEAPSLISEATCEVGGLIVRLSHRRKGVGRTLMEKVEQWAAQRGCKSVLLATQIKREDAYKFYQRLGYLNSFTTYFMRKKLSG